MYSTKLDGRTEEFGTSGLLYRSNKLMYDRTTNSLWNQFTGKPAVGPLVGQNIELEMLPVTVTTWGEWVKAHPDTTVLALDTGVYPPYAYPPEWDQRSIYYPYRISPDTMFPVWRENDQLSTKGQVLGLALGEEARAYPLEMLAEVPVVNDQLGGEGVVLVSTGERGGVRAYKSDIYQFSVNGDGGATADTQTILDQDNRLWRVEENALVLIEDSNQMLPRLPSHTAYWFGWYSFYPHSDIYRSENTS